MTTIVLAAGRGQRLGGPKALLAWSAPDGEAVPLAAAHARLRLASDSDRVLLVTRLGVARVLAGWLPPQAELVCSDAPDELGPAGSIAAAVAHGAVEGLVLITPVDVMPARPATVDRLLVPLVAEPGCLATRPTLRDRGGHPVVVRALVLERYQRPDPPPLRDLLRSLGPRRRDVPVDDRSVVVDLDTPADLVDLGLGAPRFLGARGASGQALQS